MSEGVWVNLWLGGLLKPINAVAHPSIDDCLDDIGSPAIGLKYRGTLVEKDGAWIEIDLSAEAEAYNRRITEEWLYTLRQTEAHGDKVA